MTELPDLRALPPAAPTRAAAIAEAMARHDPVKLANAVAGGRQMADFYTRLSLQEARPEADRRIYADTARVLAEFVAAAEVRADPRASRKLRETPFSKVERPAAAARR